MKLNPYEELDVPRDATAADVRRAYRRKAKTTHPDVEGGDAESFGRAQLAMHVLVDPERRERFDNTGTVEEDKPDNLRSSALQVIEMHLGGLVNGYVQSGFQPARDPRFLDLPVVLSAAIEIEIDKQQAAIEVGKRATEFLRDMAGRWTSEDPKDDPVAASFNAKIAANEQQLEMMAGAIACREMALDILSGYDFRHDEPDPRLGAQPAGVGTFTFTIERR